MTARRRPARLKARTSSEGEVILDAVEAAYDLAAADRSWLQRLLKAIAPCFDHGLGMVAFFYDVSDPEHVVVRDVVGHETDAAVLRTVAPMVRAYTPEHVRQSFWGPTLTGTTFEAFGFKPSPASAPNTPELAQEVIDFGFPRKLVDVMESTQSGDTLYLRCQRPDKRGVLLSALLPRPGSTSPRFRARWSRVSAHLLNAWRLRERLAQAEARAATPEAVLTPGGRLADAQFDPSRAQRETLASAVRARERARGPLRRQGPDEALDLWQGLVTSRWSLVDKVDRDGRRFVLARRNDPSALPLDGLTLRERQIITLALQGHANKLIAYTLGLSISTVATHLRNGTAKLDRTSRQRLARRPP